jgi:RNA polymerase sigma-70 factor (ECF subfamily)
VPLWAGGWDALQFHSFDSAYLQRLREGDFRTQDHFVRYFTELIKIKLRSRLRSPQAIEDVRQETFTRVFAALQNPDSIREPERLGAYVNSVCNYVLLEHYRAVPDDAPIDDTEESRLPSRPADALNGLISKQMSSQVREILEQMPERDRRLLREVFFEEKDKDDVCRDFGVDRDYLRVLLHRAKQSFKSLYLKQIAQDLPATRRAQAE